LFNAATSGVLGGFMAEQMTFSLLHEAVSGAAAAIRSVTKLQPVGGPGDKLFPATYSQGKYATEKRKLPDEKDLVQCVLINSVQSEANHAELALKDAYENGAIRIPIVEVDLERTRRSRRSDWPFRSDHWRTNASRVLARKCA
jgi:CRISPR-associated protein Csb1